MISPINRVATAITMLATCFLPAGYSHAQQVKAAIRLDSRPNNYCVQAGGTGELYVQNLTNQPIHVVFQRFWQIRGVNGQDKPEQNLSPGEKKGLGCAKDGEGNTQVYNLLRAY